MHFLVEARACQLRQSGGIVRIGLVRLHGLQALVRLTSIDAYHRYIQIAKSKADRRRHPARFDHSTINRTVALQHQGQRIGRTLDLFRHELPTIFVNDADLRAFHRQVQSGIVFHGCFLPSGFDNQKCAPQPRPEGSSRNYTMTLIILGGKSGGHVSAHRNALCSSAT